MLSFQNFRESYCRYDMDLLDNLEGIHNSSICQEACRYRKKCNFFQYFEDDKICKLQNTHSDLRECDIIHGTPTPTLESCNYQKKIQWASGTCCLALFLMFRFAHTVTQTTHVLFLQSHLLTLFYKS